MSKAPVLRNLYLRNIDKVVVKEYLYDHGCILQHRVDLAGNYYGVALLVERLIHAYPAAFRLCKRALVRYK